ncbi:MAG: formylglycine-generating enzyme family protein [Bacteroidales bacterium]|jgi:formylglycine-generating enzyme required for sulfatase activity|nr:formylglycine-generating enzyme family protein [Bacteroidales bacterium]
MSIIKVIRNIFLAFIIQYFLFESCSKIASANDDVYTNSIGIEFVLIPSKTYIIDQYDPDKKHQVTISKPFYLGKFEVTQSQWISVMGSNPNSPTKPDHPVSLVSWDDTQEFIKRLNQMEGHNRYRLPTEAEWELAATTGGNWGTPYYFPDDEERDKYAWSENNSGGYARQVGQKLPNPFGLYDILGNVSEWVFDWYTYDYENVEKYGSVDPIGTTVVNSNVPGKSVRGGNYGGSNCWSIGRFYWGKKNESIGFRLALSLE